MKKKVLILGSSGLIGHQIYNYLEKNSNYILSNISFKRKLNNYTILIDARNLRLLINQIEQINPDIIINCIGILIADSNNDPDSAKILNSVLPHKLDELTTKINAKLVHISTDCVFSGDNQNAYIETDLKDGRGIYAQTKALGEVINQKNLTLRTSVVGPELKSNGVELFHWFMMQKNNINGFTKAQWSGVTTLELAKAVKWALEYQITGLYHITNNKSISKNELLSIFKKYTKKNIIINPDDSLVINKIFIDTRKEINYQIPSYDQMINDMIIYIKENRAFYKHYDL